MRRRESIDEARDRWSAGEAYATRLVAIAALLATAATVAVGWRLGLERAAQLVATLSLVAVIHGFLIVKGSTRATSTRAITPPSPLHSVAHPWFLRPQPLPTQLELSLLQPPFPPVCQASSEPLQMGTPH